MSESGEDSDTGGGAAERVEAQDLPPAVQRPSGLSLAAVAWLALLLSLAALAASGYLVVEHWRAQQLAANSSESFAALQNRVTDLNESLALVDNSVQSLIASDQDIEAQAESLRGDFDERTTLLDSLPARLSNLERSVASITGAASGTRDAWLLGEAEYYMQIANAQLQLGGNPDLAALALGMADDRIAQMGDPALTGVRRAIANELAALELMSKPDVEGITLTLASLANIVDLLPLKGDTDESAADAAAADEDLSRTARAWASIKGAFSGLVNVTRPDETNAILISPNADRLIRTNLTLQLQAARLALLRNEQAIFDQSLADADAWLEQYFDTGSEPVVSARQTIAEMADGVFAVTAPDISVSLRLLRQFKALPESPQ